MHKKPSAPSHRTACMTAVRHVGRALLAALAFAGAATAFAGTASFSLFDQTGLPTGHKVYVLGYSATPGYYLKSDGTWQALSTKKGQIPCYEMGTGTNQISKIIIDSSQSSLSARVYFFVDDTGNYPACNNGTTSASTKGTNGIFGTQAFSYQQIGTSANYGVQGITQANIGKPKAGLPVYSFAEIGPGPQAGTIDASQVDLFSFPFTITAAVSSGPDTVGNSATISFTDNATYANYIDQVAGKNGCSNKQKRKPAACDYLDLKSKYESSYYLLLNPGSFLSANTTAAQASKLQGAFDGVIGKLWSTKAASITLSNGGPQGSAQEDTFTGKVVSMIYPCNTTGAGCPTVNAIKFTGKTHGYVAYVFSPIGYAQGCTAGTIANCPAGSIHSAGNQVFSGSGVFAATAVSEYNNLVAIQQAAAKKKSKKKAPIYLPTKTTQYGAGTYAAQVARLGLIITQAMNHGVALMTCPKGTTTWRCWNNETNWYPVKTSKTYPDITQNLYARFMHTGKNKQGTPFFTLPPNPVKSAGGHKMGMAYGFSNDENPTPTIPGVNSPEVPSKMDQTVNYGNTGTYSITLGPWNVKKAKGGGHGKDASTM